MMPRLFTVIQLQLRLKFLGQKNMSYWNFVGSCIYLEIIYLI